MSTALRLFVGLIVLMGLGVVYMASGFFTVQPDEQVVVLRLGKYHRTVGPGPHFRARLVETLDRERVTVTQKAEFGYRTISPGPPPDYEDRPDEKVMLTSDENLVNVEFVIQYRIQDLPKYLFGVAEVGSAIRDVAQAAMREVVAKNSRVHPEHAASLRGSSP